MSGEVLLEGAVRAAVLLGLGLAAARFLRGAEARRLVLVLALGGAVAAPAAVWATRAAAPAARMTLPRVPFAEPVPRSAEAPAALAAGEARAGRSAPARPAPRGRWPLGLGALWALGALAVLVRGGASVARASAMARRARPLGGAALGEAERACAMAGVWAPIRVTDELDTPAVAGAWRPVILVPRAALAWSPQRWLAVLLHELGHVRRGDTRAQLVALAACALYWPLPLVWMAARGLRRACEFAADESVLAAGVRPSSYAEHLLAVATGRAAPRGALGAASGRSDLGERIEAVVAPGASARPLSAGSALALRGAAASLLGLVACTGAGASPQPLPARPAPEAQAAAVRGEGADSTLDPALQALAEQEVARLGQEHAGSATVVALDPATGAVVAMAGEHASKATYEPGSTIKPITVALALEAGAIEAQQRFFCEQGARPYAGLGDLVDAAPHGVLDVGAILAVSSNIGTSKIYDELGGERLVSGFERFRLFEALPSAPAAPLPPTPADRSLRGACLAMGVGLQVSPLRLAAAYAALASGGLYRAPTLRRSEASAPERVVSEATASAVMKMLEGVVQGEDGTGKLARIAGRRVAGKTGTSEARHGHASGHTFASFVGVVPVEAPRLVVFVGVEAPGDSVIGGTVAAPAFARIASRIAP